MIDKFAEIPETEQGMKQYIKFASDEIKRCKAKIKKLESNISEANSRLGEINGRFSVNEASKT